MSTFKIGDRVRFKPEYARQGYDKGTVTQLGSGHSGPWAAVTFDGAVWHSEWMIWSLELAPIKRGPRPLPIRQRVTLTAGRTLRAPAREVWSQVHTLRGPRLRDGVRVNRPWGKTGRVSLDGEVLPWVLVDGRSVGWLYSPDDDYSGWGPRTNEGYLDEHLPSLDAAVMWVLRRVDPKLWREERGEVPRLQIADDAWIITHPTRSSRVLYKSDPSGGTWSYEDALDALAFEAGSW